MKIKVFDSMVVLADVVACMTVGSVCSTGSAAEGRGYGEER